MLFSLNQFIAVSHSLSKTSKTSAKFFLLTYNVLSSAKLARSASFMNRNKSFINKLKRTGPSMDLEEHLIVKFGRGFLYHLF